MSLIHRALLERKRRRVHFIRQETFLESVKLSIGLNEESFAVDFTLPDGFRISSSELLSFCLESHFVFVSAVAGVSDKDLLYARTEGWALILALANGLREHCLVANPPPRIDFTQSRASAILLMQEYGIPAPRLHVTSDPAAVSSFYNELKGQVICKHVKEGDVTFKKLDQADMQRVDKIAACPVHVEEFSPGQSVRVIVVGNKVFSYEERQAPGGPLQLLQFPSDGKIEEKCAAMTRDLGLALGEIRLRKTPEGNWEGLGIHPFVTAPSLEVFEPDAGNIVLAAVAECLETGVAP